MRDGQCKSLGCRQGLNHFSKIHAVGPLSGALGGGISRLKSAHVLCMVQPLGKLLAGYLLERLPVFAQYDFLLPMPKHPARVAEKGFDQVRELFDVACRYMTPEIRCDNLRIAPYLIQNRPVKSLHTETNFVEERYQEVSGCFDLSFVTPIFRGANILVFDDVLTSGATLSAAADALLAAGAASVDGIVLARTP